MLRKVMNEMMREAAQEIGFEHSGENVDQVLANIESKYDIVVIQDGPVTWQIMDIIVDEIAIWQKDTKQYL